MHALCFQIFFDSKRRRLVVVFYNVECALKGHIVLLLLFLIEMKKLFHAFLLAVPSGVKSQAEFLVC